MSTPRQKKVKQIEPSTRTVASGYLHYLDLIGKGTHTVEGVAAPLEPSPLVIEIARELYDRFVMGGWEPKDAYPQIEAWLAAVSKNLLEELANAKKDLAADDRDMFAIASEIRCDAVREDIVKGIRQFKSRISELEKEIAALRTAQSAVTGTESHWRGRDAALREKP